MPTIELLHTRKKELKKNQPSPSPKYHEDDSSFWAAKCYNTLRWRKLREAQLQKQPLCEQCLKDGIVTPATDVHHIMELSQAGTYLEMMDIAFDSNNLMSLCHRCHQDLHANKHLKKR